jgi:hypothetical protein
VKAIEERARDLMTHGLDTRDAFGHLPRWASSIAEKEATERFLREQLGSVCGQLADAERRWSRGALSWLARIAVAGALVALGASLR